VAVTPGRRMPGSRDRTDTGTNEALLGMASMAASGLAGVAARFGRVASGSREPFGDHPSRRPEGNWSPRGGPLSQRVPTALPERSSEDRGRGATPILRGTGRWGVQARRAAATQSVVSRRRLRPGPPSSVPSLVTTVASPPEVTWMSRERRGCPGSGDLPGGGRGADEPSLGVPAGEEPGGGPAPAAGFERDEGPRPGPLREEGGQDLSARAERTQRLAAHRPLPGEGDKACLVGGPRRHRHAEDSVVGRPGKRPGEREPSGSKRGVEGALLHRAAADVEDDQPVGTARVGAADDREPGAVAAGGRPGSLRRHPWAARVGELRPAPRGSPVEEDRPSAGRHRHVTRGASGHVRGQQTSPQPPIGHGELDHVAPPSGCHGNVRQLADFAS
jgi:hypothetical protein